MDGLCLELAECARALMPSRRYSETRQAAFPRYRRAPLITDPAGVPAAARPKVRPASADSPLGDPEVE